MDIVSTMGKVAGCRPQPQRAGEGESPARRTGEHGAPERRPQGEERAGRWRARRGTGRLDGVRAPGEAMPEAK